ncbi:MAG: hypothetical protein KGJ13_09530 [Patescibacteria group bacterium]|nr:hypothetical protein [Patescibacteria group bacterium]
MHGSPITKYEAQDIRQRAAALCAWLTDHKTNSYKPEQVAHINPPTNSERSDCEIFEFLHNPPDTYFAYVTKKEGRWQAINWPGAPLSEWCHVGAEYCSDMGDKRRAIEFMGINGVRYVGTFYCGAGDYCRVRRAK